MKLSVTTKKSKGRKFLDLLKGKKSEKVFLADPRELWVHPRRYHKFSKRFVEKVKYLQRVFNEVLPFPLSQWMDKFDRDEHPQEELAIWLHMARVYTKIIKNFPNKLEFRKEIFQIILLSSMGDEKYVLSQIRPTYLSKKEIISIINTYNKTE